MTHDITPQAVNSDEKWQTQTHCLSFSPRDTDLNDETGVHVTLSDLSITILDGERDVNANDLYFKSPTFLNAAVNKCSAVHPPFARAGEEEEEEEEEWQTEHTSPLLREDLIYITSPTLHNAALGERHYKWTMETAMERQGLALNGSTGSESSVFSYFAAFVQDGEGENGESFSFLENMPNGTEFAANGTGMNITWAPQSILCKGLYNRKESKTQKCNKMDSGRKVVTFAAAPLCTK